MIETKIAFAFNNMCNNISQDENAALGYMTLYEGNGGTQDVVCNLSWENSDKFWDFQHCGECANDESR